MYKSTKCSKTDVTALCTELECTHWENWSRLDRRSHALKIPLCKWTPCSSQDTLLNIAPLPLLTVNNMYHHKWSLFLFEMPWWKIQDTEENNVLTIFVITGLLSLLASFRPAWQTRRQFHGSALAGEGTCVGSWIVNCCHGNSDSPAGLTSSCEPERNESAAPHTLLTWCEPHHWLEVLQWSFFFLLLSLIYLFLKGVSTHCIRKSLPHFQSWMRASSVSAHSAGVCSSAVNVNESRCCGWSGDLSYRVSLRIFRSKEQTLT